MLVLHAFWAEGAGPRVWAEDSELPVTSPSQAVRRARPHPFAVPSELLTSIVAGTAGTAGSTALLLPSVRRAPLDSPELVRTARRAPAASTPSLLAWEVPTVSVDAAMLASTLARVTDPDIEVKGDLDIRPSASLHYLAELASYADELTSRGRVLPGLDLDGPTPRARWQVALTGPDAVAAHALIAAMPPAFRATDVAIPPARLAIEALSAIADVRVRARSTTSLLPPRRARQPRRPPAIESWLEALTGDDPRIDADPGELSDLARTLQPWAAAGREPPGPAQLVVRLSDPRTARTEPGGAADEPGWVLDFLRRSRADPSLLVEASRIWADDGALGRWLESPRQVLLAELARAQRVYPGLEHGLRQAQPTSIGLDVEASHHFLSAAAPALSEAGFEVQLPGWWSRRQRLGLRLSTTASDAGAADAGIGREQLCDFRWELAVGDHGLSEEEIAALAAAKAPLVQLRGEWVAINRDQLARGLEFLHRNGAGQLTVGEILALSVSHPDDLDLPLELVDVAADGWLGDLLGGVASETLSDVEPPDGFTATLRPYQRRGLAWLDFLRRLRLGACLADDMGLGKTVQLLALEATCRARGAAQDGVGVRPTLLLCPVSLIGNWQAEAARFAPTLRVVTHHGPDRFHGDDLAAVVAASDLVITTYTTALSDIEELSEIEFDRVVLDEAQAIKNRLSRTAKAVRRLQAEQRIALTGTPVENRLAELWSIMDFVNPGILGSPDVFRMRFAAPIERYRDERASGLLRRITRPYILRRVKTDPTIIDDLPEKIEIKQHYRLTVEQASLYQSVVDEMMERIEGSEGIERRGNVLAAMTKLKQVCNHPAQLLHDRSPIGRRSGKVIRLEEILAEGDRVLCFTQYTEFAEMLLPHLSARFDTDVAYLSGSTPRHRRTELVDLFQSGEGPPIFLLSLKAGGTGLNLTSANHVLHLDRWWNPAVENQATDRAFRIGQRRRVQVRKFVATGTLEERIDKLIDDKQALADLVGGDGESWLTDLSTSQLRDLFALSKGAVGE